VCVCWRVNVCVVSVCRQHKQTNTGERLNVYACTCVCMRACVCVCMRMYLCVCAQVPNKTRHQVIRIKHELLRANFKD